MTSKTWRQASTGYSHVVVLGPVMPAEQTSTSMPPSCRPSRAPRRSTATRIGDVRILRRCDRPSLSLAVASARSSRSHSATRAPLARAAARRRGRCRRRRRSPRRAALRKSSWFIASPINGDAARRAHALLRAYDQPGHDEAEAIRDAVEHPRQLLENGPATLPPCNHHDHVRLSCSAQLRRSHAKAVASKIAPGRSSPRVPISQQIVISGCQDRSPAPVGGSGPAAIASRNPQARMPLP